MTSARNYWTAGELWSDWRYWTLAAWLRRKQAEMLMGRYGYVMRSEQASVNAATMKANASYDVLCNRKPGLRHPDMSAGLAVEGYSKWPRSTQRRY